jgi:hypothetical protein
MTGGAARKASGASPLVSCVVIFGLGSTVSISLKFRERVVVVKDHHHVI